MAGSTVKIHRSRALSFKKISFLYLVFIVFYFFSTSGDYIKQYESMHKTQVMLNGILQSQLQDIECKNLEDIAIKNKTLDFINQIEQAKIQLRDVIGSTITLDEKLKETKFSKKFIENGNYDNLKSEMIAYAEMFPDQQKQSLLTVFGLSNQTKNPLFINIPNGFMGNIFNNYQTIALKNTLNFFSTKALVKNETVKKSVEKIKRDPFLQSLKSVYYIGEEVLFSLNSNNGSLPKLHVNEQNIDLKESKENTYTAKWLPSKPGYYSIIASNEGNEQFQQIEVKSLDLKFLENIQEVVCNMNEPFTLTPYLGKELKIKDLSFLSKEAVVEIEGNHLKITPIVEGRFNLLVKLGKQTIENLSLFSKINTAPIIQLKDKYNQLTELANAYALTSNNKIWQVAAFNMVIINPNGTKQSFHSNNRFLNGDMLAAQKSMPEGSGIVFEQIKLLFNDGIKTTNGRPIYIQK